MARIGLQLYSLRETIPGRVAETLRTLSEMGYEGVETAGTYGRDGATLGGLIRDAGLECAGAHVGLDALKEDVFSETAALYRAIGTDRLIVPAASLDPLPPLLDELRAIQARAAVAGVKAGYHNHAREFEPVGDSNAFERIFAATPAEFLVQVDIGWAAAAGQDVPDLLRRHAGRIETVHIKEFKEGDRSCLVGEGDVDWPPIFRVLRDLPRLEWLIIEQEQHPIDPIESVRRCLAATREMQG